MVACLPGRRIRGSHLGLTGVGLEEGLRRDVKAEATHTLADAWLACQQMSLLNACLGGGWGGGHRTVDGRLGGGGGGWKDWWRD